MGLFDWLTNREKDDFMDGYREGQRDAMFGDSYKFDTGRIGGSKKRRAGYEMGFIDEDGED